MPRKRTVKIGDVVCITWMDITEQKEAWRPKGEHIEAIEVESYGVVVKLPDEENGNIEIIGDTQVNGDHEGRGQCKWSGVIKRIRVAPPIEKWIDAELPE